MENIFPNYQTRFWRIVYVMNATFSKFCFAMGVNYKRYLVYNSIVQNVSERFSTAAILKSDKKGEKTFLLSYCAICLNYFDNNA